MGRNPLTDEEKPARATAKADAKAAKDKQRADAKAAKAQQKADARQAADEKPALDDEQRKNLFVHHVEQYREGLALKKKTDAGFKNMCKRAVADLGKDGIENIKLAIRLETDEGRAEVAQEMAAAAEVVRWAGFEARIGTQFGIFDSALVPIVERDDDEVDENPTVETASGERVSRAEFNRRMAENNAQAQATIKGTSTAKVQDAPTVAAH